MKAFFNVVLVSNNENDHCGAQKIFLDSRYACTDIFAILFEEMKLIVVETCRQNRIGLPGKYEWLKFAKSCRERNL